MDDYTTLQVVWFVLIGVLWIGYFVLEGFDFGVGILLKILGGTDAEKRQIIHSIGPVWDGNEVWLLTAGGATFAAFPQWYATLFSGFYLALFAILVALIVRNVGFEFWGKRDDPAWRNRWEWCIALGSFVPALLWGVAWANIIHGVPIDAQAEFTGNFFTLLNPYALLGGLVTLSVFLAHGALFLSLRTTGDLEAKARKMAVSAMPVAAALAAVFLVWTVGNQDPVVWVSVICALLSIGALIVASVLAKSSPAKAFAGTCLAILLFFTALFSDLFPMTMISSTNSAFDMTLNFSSSSHYTLTVMTVVAALLVPVVLLYQGWTYWVFRARLTENGFHDVHSPLDLIDASRRKVDGGTGPDQPDSGRQA